MKRKKMIAYPETPPHLKLLRLMKLTVLLLTIACLQVSARGYSQTKITMKLQDAEIKKALSAIEKLSEFHFLYNQAVVANKPKVSIDITAADITTVLNALFANTGISYHLLKNNLIVLNEEGAGNTFIQDIRVTGKVTGTAGEPLTGVSVSLKGTGVGTETDATGNFAITVPNSGAVLVFSYVGFASQEVPVGNKTTINVTLSTSTSELNTIVVVGYGTQRKKDVTGAYASIRGSELARQPVQTATQALQGKVAGVQVISSGEPNSLPSIRLRGTGSVLAGANPLYVVDGVLTDDIRNINTADILTFDVLKDASASAIYGVRGANGVIIITTKKGHAGKTIFTYDGNAGVREATNLVDMAGEQQYAGYLNEASQFYGSGAVLIQPSTLQGANTDWYDAILRRGFWQNHNLSMSGGSDKATYFLSGGYLNEEGILRQNKYQRFTLRSNMDYKLSRMLNLNTQISYSRGDARGGQLGAFSNAYRAAPIVPAKQNGLYGNTSLVGNVANPLLDIEKNYDQVIGNRFQGNVALDLKPITGLTLRTAFNIDADFSRSRSYGYPYASDASVFLVAGGNQARTISSFSTTNNNAFRYVWDNTATYNKSVGDHTFTLLGGYVVEEFRFNSLVGNATGVPQNQNQWYLNAGTGGSQSVSNTGDKLTRLSYLARLNYSYHNRYLLTASYRRDGSSKFGDSKRYGSFPSLGLGWSISDESFFRNIKTVNNLKLRASYGRKGNENIPSSQFLSVATQNIPYYFSGSVNQGIRIPNITDPNLGWENTDEVDLGLDFALLKNRLTGTFDWYDKKAKDALIFIPIPAIFGDPDNQYLTNATTISNKGVELTLSWADKINRDWSYGISVNAAHNKNNIEKLNGGSPIYGSSVANYLITRTDNGQPIASYYLREAIGIFQSQAEIDASAQRSARLGDIIYRDISGPQGKPDGVIDDFDRSFQGSYQPKFMYGVNGNLSYKHFDLNFTSFGQTGGKIYNGKKAARGVNQLTDNIEADEARNRWTPNNRNTGLTRAHTGSLPASTYYLEKADFFRLNNLTIGYAIPSTMFKKGQINSVRIYFTGQNLFTVTPYKGFTPEINNSILNNGVDVNTYPSTRTFAFGLNVGF
ncbi:MAG: TonB-dependent receptor [Bacteroidota bacterium]|nr:TonB-dependent receptor [Bacteroidota bacterium]